MWSVLLDGFGSLAGGVDWCCWYDESVQLWLDCCPLLIGNVWSYKKLKIWAIYLLVACMPWGSWCCFARLGHRKKERVQRVIQAHAIHRSVVFVCLMYVNCIMLTFGMFIGTRLNRVLCLSCCSDRWERWVNVIKVLIGWSTSNKNHDLVLRGSAFMWLKDGTAWASLIFYVVIWFAGCSGKLECRLPRQWKILS